MTTQERYRADTHTLRLNPDAPMSELLALSGAVIRAGGLVAFPTETVYGLGANALDEKAVDRIFSAKERPANDPIIVHIADTEQLAVVSANIPPMARELAAVFWPGPLTLILPKHPSIPLNITAGRDTVAVRCPAHAVARGLIEAAGVPIGAPSANRFSRPSPTTAAHVAQDLEGHVDIILDAGPVNIGLESTILDLTSARPRILRPGGVPLEALRPYLPDLQFTPLYLDETAEAAPAPGALLRHYSPQAKVWVYEGERAAVHAAMRTAIAQAEPPVGALVLDADVGIFEDSGAEVVALGRDVTEMARALFAALRELDARGVRAIFAYVPDTLGLGLAVRDRLVRAAEGRVIRVPITAAKTD